MSDSSIKKIKIGNSEYDLTASNGIYYIEGTGSTAGTWLGSHSDITSYYPGLMIAYKIGIAGASATTLNINNLGAVTVVKNATTAISTNFAVNSVIFLVYTVDGSTAYWKAHDYDANTKNTAGTSEKASTKLYITGATSQTSSGTTTYSNQKVYIGTDNSLYSNSSKVITQADTATTSAAGIMSAADKTKLDGIATGANAYTHPTTSGNKHIPSGGSSGQILRWSADGTATWGADNNTTYSAATQSAAGLMSAADKTKLDGISGDKIVTFTITGNCVNHEYVTINTTYANIKSLIDSGKIVHLLGSENVFNGKIVFISQYYMESSEYGNCIIFASDLWYDSTIYLALYADNTAYISATMMTEGSLNYDTTNFSEGSCWWEKKGHIVRYFASLKTKKDMYLWEDYVIASNIPWGTWWETHGEPNDSGCYWAENGTLYFYVWASVNAWAEDRWGNSYIPKESWITGQLTQFLYESDAI